MGVRLGHIGTAAALFATACGALETPDLGTGTVGGRIAGAASPATGYAYVLGAPQLRSPLAADGSFELAKVPAGPQQLVLFDGLSRADLAAVVVAGGMRTRLDRDSSAMPLAGRIAAAARPEGGCASGGTRFTLEGTIHQAVAATGGGTVLDGLPAGSYRLTAALAGFRPLPVDVPVAAGATSGAEVALQIDGEPGVEGCLSTPCREGLHCSPSDGRCYACLDDSHCGSGDHCDAASHTCVEGLSGQGDLCESATDASMCASGVWVATGDGLGYCSRACAAAADCPSGWYCAAGVCQVVSTCAAIVATVGSACVYDDTCQQALAGGHCLRPDADDPGYCTAPCASAASCTVPGYGSCSSGPDGISYCQEP